MINRLILFAVIIFVALFLGIFLLSTLNINPKQLKSLRIDPREVSNIAIYKEGKPYLLNYEQQEKVIAILNKASSYSKEIPLEKNIPIEKIEFIYFEAPSFIIKPVGFIENEYLFYIPEWNKNGLTRDNSQGSLKHLLDNTYD